MRSPAFETMFSDRWDKHTEISITDIDSKTFGILLRYLYTDDLVLTNLSVENTAALLYAAKKYELCIMQKMCVDSLRASITTSTVLDILQQAIDLDEVELQKACLKTIDLQAADILSGASFQSVSLDLLEYILPRNELGIEESDLFLFANKWAESTCIAQDMSPTAENKRKVIQPILKYIRFPIMTPQEFTDGPAKSGLLTMEEIGAVYMSHYSEQPVGFSFTSIPRSSKTLISWDRIISYYDYLEHHLIDFGTWPTMFDAFRLTATAKNLKLHGLKIVGSGRVHKQLRVTVQIQKPQTDGLEEQKFSCDAKDNDDKGLALIKLPTPLQILEHQQCAIKVIITAGLTTKYGNSQYSADPRHFLVDNAYDFNRVNVTNSNVKWSRFDLIASLLYTV